MRLNQAKGEMMMSYIVKTGQEAAEAATREPVDYSKVLKSFSSGKSYTVKIIPDCFVMYYAHSVYKVFYTSPCTTKATGVADLYCKAADLLYKDAKALEEAGADEKEVEAIRKQAYALKAKERYLIGFWSLDENEPAPMIIDLTKKQAKTIINTIKKNASKADKFAFVISKEGTGQGTIVSLDIVVDDEDLTPQQRANFEKAKELKFDEELFEKVLKVADEEQQIEDLTKFGFDVSRLGIEEGTEAEGDNAADKDLGF
jgi:hypothetical protein